MPSHICTACGTGFEPSASPPPRCPICEEERQYVPPSGQSWTTMTALGATHANAWRRHEEGLLSLATKPSFGIGQRAFLLRTEAGNVLWDCVSLLDEATIDIVRALGGLHAIAISHPHYYATWVEWSRAFGGVPVYLHEADAAWIMRRDPSLRGWAGERREIAPGVTLVRTGGHFDGGTVLHWRGGAGGRGVLLSGDIVQVAADIRRVSFLWSYPNMLPLSAARVQRIAGALAPFAFDRLYGAFEGREVTGDAHAAVARSAARYIELLGET